MNSAGIGQIKFDLSDPRFSVIFPPMIWIFMEVEDDEIKSKHASKKDRTLNKTPNHKHYPQLM